MGAIEDYFNDHIKQDMRFINNVGKECQLLLQEQEAFNIINLTRSTYKLTGNIAEVGVYQGGSAKLIAEYKNPDKKLYLFDTFDGIPYSSVITPDHCMGDFSSSFNSVKNYLSNYSNIIITPGIFPQETSNIIENEQFSFVHLDVDVFQSTLDALNFFYPRMVSGGIILSHDYLNLLDVRCAFEQFVKDRECGIFPLCKSNTNNGILSTQCMIIKS